ncbi:hypothetical protein [Burkholderia gladioli]|uniref:hypothetical protein n=1 Tax=Burkholderia gladioli TaxID=28095 RepID=UPI0034DB5C5D
MDPKIIVIAGAVGVFAAVCCALVRVLRGSGVSRWQPTEITTLVREVPRAAAPGELTKFFPRHSINGIRWKARTLALPWPRGKRAGRKS